MEDSEADLLADIDDLLDEIDAVLEDQSVLVELPAEVRPVNRGVIVPGGSLKLQATLSSSSSGTGDASSPHHPITCNGELPAGAGRQPALRPCGRAARRHPDAVLHRPQHLAAVDGAVGRRMKSPRKTHRSSANPSRPRVGVRVPAQQNVGAGVEEGGGEWLDPDTPPQLPPPAQPNDAEGSNDGADGRIRRRDPALPLSAGGILGSRGRPGVSWIANWPTASAMVTPAR